QLPCRRPRVLPRSDNAQFRDQALAGSPLVGHVRPPLASKSTQTGAGNRGPFGWCCGVAVQPAQNNMAGHIVELDGQTSMSVAPKSVPLASSDSPADLARA